jgi:hypothetical protein
MRMFSAAQWMVVGFLCLVLCTVLLLLYNVIGGRFGSSDTNNVRGKDGLEFLERVAYGRATAPCRSNSPKFGACVTAARRFVSHCGFAANERDESRESETAPDKEMFHLVGAYSFINRGDTIVADKATLQNNILSPHTFAVNKRDRRYGQGSYYEPRAPHIRRFEDDTVFHVQNAQGWKAIPDGNLSTGDLTSIGYRQMYELSNIFRTNYYLLLRENGNTTDTGTNNQIHCSSKSLAVHATNNPGALQVQDCVH